MRQIICFHKPNEQYGYLSNWYKSVFYVNRVKYSSMEQYIMYQKALVFDDKQIAEQILNTDNVEEIKALGRKIKNYNDTIWNGLRQIVVYKGLIEKFIQNDELKQKLISTDDAILAECAVKDTIWGIGISMRDEKRFNMNNWKGQNLLGFTLMMVRQALIDDNII